MQDQITADVRGKLLSRNEDSARAYPRLSAVSPAIAGPLLEAVPNVVRTALDLAVKLGGDAVGALVESEHDAIRAFVSQKTLEFLDGLVHGLEDVKAVHSPR
jgi:hypothetical protein